MTDKKGNLSINSENLFPIIKKWLYSDQDIFVREMISNATDAITKLRKLSLIGEYNAPADEKYKITVEISPNRKTLSFIDNGLGMTADEVEEYINQVAFSGAKDFIEKYKDKANDDQIIGHFGLGFYSAFMVADKVTIDTLSYKDGSEAVHWESDGNGEFEMTSSERTEHGTTITLYLNDNCYEYCNEYRVKEVLEKYCSFMPEEIYLVNADEEAKKAAEAAKKAAEESKAQEDGKSDKDGDKSEEDKPQEPKPVNDIHPLWTKTPSECKEEEYKEFYRKVFHDYREPLFWIHLNMDYPFNLKGILYFPKVNLEYETLEGTIKLYNNQVFIADNIKEVIPEFLMLLKGVIDCPDLPLNVSRSALQNDGFVKKIQDYINKKVADKLVGMCKTDRENYEKCWDDISPFIKYGYLKDEKFGSKMFDYILYKDINGKYLTFKDLVPEDEKTTATDDKGNAVEAEIVDDPNNTAADGSSDAEDNKEKEKTKVYYVSDEREQSQFVNRFKEDDKTAVLLTHNIDMPFVQRVEMAKDNVSFVRIDTEIDTEEIGEDDKKKFEKLGEKIKKYIGNDKLKVEIKELKDAGIASMITTSEESLRMQEMMKQYGMMGMNMGDMGMTEQTLVLNAKHPLVQYLVDHKKSAMTEKVANQLYDLALVSNNQLAPDRIPEFIKRTNEIMVEITK
ncbi:MAG: molecular chaperone HtpG [Lachnospiraceae bacterium]|nr:molecular chaperone HtpG [Lachnospiraceae bacterium]